ncbi:IS4 family transposase [Bradyrhizobium sp. AS23.2]|uniref:IS4 family transposase n=1 Tax=Bradyrhizobium sp. AS23.2 TaxID=1680155 RepID=UPI00093BD07E|nr:IS4 family transposase [Bradyrhizobium sp. AS23.2]OKO66920.1 transposase [Bradyrhizobium sp. AS23.2]
MPHHNTVFRDILKLMPWRQFEALVEEHDADARVRRLPTKLQFVALLYGQLSGASGLREIVTGLSSHEARLYHLGAAPVRRSTFSDANANRPFTVFADLLALMMKQAHRGLRRKMAEAVYLIDSTSVRLNGHSADWAQLSAGVCGAKVHVIYDADADRPIYAAVTAANVNDITAAHQMPIDPGATYVFDLGYYDYLWWAALDAAGCRIVTRFKSNTPLDVVEELEVAAGSNILSDRIGFLPVRQAKSRCNPMQDAVREVRVMTDTGKVLRILSNDLDASAENIAGLYRRRWAIELFFRWVKQTLKITRCVGTSENAVRIQIAVALIAFLLLSLAQATQKAVRSPLVFARLVRANLMHRRSIQTLIEPKSIPQDQSQLSLSLC